MVKHLTMEQHHGQRPRELTRRAAAVGVTAFCLTGCDRIAAHPDNPRNAHLSAEDKALKYKFRGIAASELLVDSITEIHGVNMFESDGNRFYVSAALSFQNRSRHGYAGLDFPMPKSIRVEWRDRYITAQDPPQERPVNYVPDTFWGGTILGNYTVKIAERIPDQLLDEVRQGRDSLRLKIRVHPQGVLVGWDRWVQLERDGESAGGDFREAKIYNGIAVRKGWYIHPKTGQKIETDF